MQEQLGYTFNLLVDLFFNKDENNSAALQMRTSHHTGLLNSKCFNPF